MKIPHKKALLISAAVLGLAAVSAPQLKQVIKVLGVGVAVDRFGPEMDKQFDKLTKHVDTDDNYTKVVPIISVGVGAKSAIGAAQVKGAKVNVDKVRAVAAPEIELFGREIRLRAMIPIATKSVDSRDAIKPVDGVGVSGIVDLKL